MTFVVVGASSGLGRALAESLAARGHALLLAASDERDLGALAADLAIVHGVRVDVLAHDAADAVGLAARLRDAVPAEEPVEGLLLPLGLTADDDDGTLAGEALAQVVSVNLTAVAEVVAAFLPALLAAGRGAIVGFGSVAAERGRGRNVAYAACKRALESYFESLRHRAEPHGISVSWYVLGYLDTNLTWGQELPFPAADPRAAAARVCRELGRRRGRRYHPRWWWLVGRVVRAVPWAVYKRLGF